LGDAAYIQQVKPTSDCLDANALSEKLLDVAVRIEAPASTIVTLQDQSSALLKEQARLDVEGPDRHQRQILWPP
jgi:hypothetical protein